MPLQRSGQRFLRPDRKRPGSALRASGHEVKRLVRGAVTASDQLSWDPVEPLAPESVSGFDAVIHLAGESIATRWTEAKKRRIVDSRVPATQQLAAALSKAAAALRASLSAPQPSATTAIAATKSCVRTVPPAKDLSGKSAASGKRPHNL